MNKQMLRAFGLSLLAALGLMAFAAVGAQAETLTGTAGKYLILGLENLHASFTGELVGAGTLLTPALNSELVCQRGDVLSGLILSSTDAHIEVLFLECEYWGTKTTKHASGVELLELTTKLPCEILEEGTLAQKAILAKALLLPILHNGDSYILVENLGVGILVTTPGECPLPKLVSLTGSTVFKVILGDLNLGPAEIHVTLESNKTIAKLFSDKLLYGVNESFIDSKILLKLIGAHANCTWGVV